MIDVLFFLLVFNVADAIVELPYLLLSYAGLTGLPFMLPAAVGSFSLAVLAEYRMVKWFFGNWDLFL